MDRGFDLLDRNNPQEALKIGLQLERERYSGGFELQALALAALRRHREAIAVLERGVETVPDIWLLWQLLGNYRSDAGDYDGAIAAYEQIDPEDCDVASLAYNHANALARAERWADAEARLAAAIGGEALAEAEPRLALYIVNLQEDLLRRKGDDEGADAFVEANADILARAAKAR
jgi:tetratricopeptide (TPR) repeat protein